MLSAFSFTSSPVEKARSLFAKLDQGNAYVDSLVSVTSKYVSSPLMLAYNGAAKTAKASYLSNPFDKYNTAKKGLAVLNKSVSKSPSSLEVRFIRYSVELKIPAIMPFTNHTKADRKFIMDHLDTKHVYYAEIKSFMLKYAGLSQAEKAKFK